MGGERHVPAALPKENEPVSIVKEAGWVPQPVWTGAENLALTGIRSQTDGLWPPRRMASDQPPKSWHDPQECKLLSGGAENSKLPGV